MRRNILIICDEDEVYCRRLDAELQKRLMMPAEIFCFTRADMMMEFSEREKPLMLIISEGMLEKVSGSYESMLILEEDLNEPNVEKDIREDQEDPVNVSDEVIGPVSGHIRRVSKFRSAEVLISNILELCAQIPDERIGGIPAGEITKARRIVFYSPVHGKGQTGLSAAMARYLAGRGRRVLMLNLEPCSGWSIPARIPGTPNPPVRQEDEDGEEDTGDRWEGLAELVYYSSGSEAKFRIHLERLVKKYAEADYIPPVRIPGRLRSIGRKQWQDLFRQIDSCSIYDDLVIDLTDAVEGLEEFTDTADLVITVTGDDPVSERRQREYEQGLILWGDKDILYRTKKVMVPGELRGPDKERELIEFAGKLIDE